MKKWLFFAGMLVCWQAWAGIEIDVTNSGAQVQAKDTVRLRNVNVTGYGNYYVDLKWDAEKMMMVVVKADKDTLSQFAATSKRYTAAANSLPDLNQACVQEFGAQYQQADWSDIKSAVGTDVNALQSFKATISMVSSEKYWVKYGGQPTYSNGCPYYVFSGGASGAGAIQADMGVDTGYCNAANNRVICVKTGNTNPFTK
jgi:hypothetical protein